MEVAKKMNALNPLWINQHDLDMGSSYEHWIYRIYIKYDDNISDPIIFTYPALDINDKNVSFKFQNEIN